MSNNLKVTPVTTGTQGQWSRPASARSTDYPLTHHVVHRPSHVRIEHICYESKDFASIMDCREQASKNFVDG